MNYYVSIFIFVMIFSQSVYSQRDSLLLDSLYLYQSHVVLLDGHQGYEAKRVKVDNEDICYLNYLLKNIESKRFVFYKPSSDSFYGMINDSKDNYIRISRNSIFCSKNKYHYILKDKLQKKWLDQFFEKYKTSFEK